MAFAITTEETGKRGTPVGHFRKVLVAVPRTIHATDEPLKAALDELIATASVTDSSGALLRNHWVASSDPSQPKLHARSIEVKDGAAVIRFVGRLSVAGIGDVPRILGQLDERRQSNSPTLRRSRPTGMANRRRKQSPARERGSRAPTTYRLPLAAGAARSMAS